ncbi:hypothetical protein [Vibrio sonorensis]|uniref:hypothetical protein n=1 Tax=Vibrio sonorensis TaxID=1004316 RepID=UPI0008D8F70F|nr:hypothetical protein [Vibrio sonorensis]
MKAKIVYVCGGFRNGQVFPEHLWLENHTDKQTYDTFIEQDVVVIDEVGEANKPFQPGCEGDAFEKDEIVRVRLDGLTNGQVVSIGGKMGG